MVLPVLGFGSVQVVGDVAANCLQHGCSHIVQDHAHVENINTHEVQPWTLLERRTRRRKIAPHPTLNGLAKLMQAVGREIKQQPVQTACNTCRVHVCRKCVTQVQAVRRCQFTCISCSRDLVPQLLRQFSQGDGIDRVRCLAPSR